MKTILLKIFIVILIGLAQYYIFNQGVPTLVETVILAGIIELMSGNIEKDKK